MYCNHVLYIFFQLGGAVPLQATSDSTSSAICCGSLTVPWDTVKSFAEIDLGYDWICFRIPFKVWHYWRILKVINKHIVINLCSNLFSPFTLISLPICQGTSRHFPLFVSSPKSGKSSPSNLPHPRDAKKVESFASRAQRQAHHLA